MPLNVGIVEKWNITDVNAHYKRKRAVQTGECLNSPNGLERHSPSEQPSIDSTIEKGAERLIDKENSYIDPWTRLVGRQMKNKLL